MAKDPYGNVIIPQKTFREMLLEELKKNLNVEVVCTYGGNVTVAVHFANDFICSATDYFPRSN